MDRKKCSSKLKELMNARKKLDKVIKGSDFDGWTDVADADVKLSIAEKKLKKVCG